jgi:site-specific DNA-methyltransferase (adenine-specific)/modification methylase
MLIDKNYDIQNGDAFKLLKEIPDNSVDLILTDPPYNLGEHSTGNLSFKNRTNINNDIGDWDKGFDPTMLVDDFIRILKPTGNLFIFCSYNLIGKYHELLDDKFDSFNFMAWHKTNPTPKFRKAGFLNSIELIVSCWNKGHNWNFGKQNEMHNFIEGPICMGTERLSDPKHPTQKPLYPLKHIINIASNPDDIILDPFMGVGSTGVASLQLNRKFIGFELEKQYFDASEKRLKQFPNSHTFF